MKKIFTLLALTITFSMNAQVQHTGTNNSGAASSAIGYFTSATGYISTAMGRNTEASGDYTTAMGRYTTASDYASTVTGQFNSSSSSITASEGFSLDNTAFVIGNGTSNDARSDAFKVMFNGDATLAGSMTATSFVGDGSQLTNLPSSGSDSPFSYNNNEAGGIEVADYTTASGSRAFAVGADSQASGNYSTAMGRGTIASGDDSTAIGANTEASGNFATAIGDFTIASGALSTAMGDSTTASGNTSTAMGLETIASGEFSTAMGVETIASGALSTAMGGGTIASGDFSTSVGKITTASDYASTAIGQYNLLGSTVTNNATQFSTANTAFVIGNGASLNNRSDALTVLFDGTTNIAGSVTATSFIGDGSQLTNLPPNSPFSPNTTSGTGIQSPTNTATGTFSVAMGDSTTASGISSTAMGSGTQASGVVSTAMGRITIASGNFATAMGDFTIASGALSTAMGDSTTASGNTSTAMGLETIASGAASTAMGFYTTASGDYSTAMGTSTTASDNSSLVIGHFNLSGSTVTANAADFSLDNTAFVVGNGTASNNRSDALVVKFNGDATLAGNLNINSDARLKANIVSLGSTLSKLLQIDGKSYTMKKDESEKQKIGLLAQDIEKVFPELVSESHGVKSVNYQGLVPVLINALKEQESKYLKQEKRLERLERLVAAMD